METVRANNIPNCLNILAHATPDDINRLHGPQESWAALHAACKLGRTVITQLLIWVRLCVCVCVCARCMCMCDRMYYGLLC